VEDGHEPTTVPITFAGGALVTNYYISYL